MTDKIKTFWDQQAKLHGASDLATAPDHHYRTLEIASILKCLACLRHETILDVGCGNGFTSLQIAKKFPAALVTGVDYSAPMIAEANALGSNIEFFEGNVLTLSRHKELADQKFDVVISTRCLINLSNWDEQKAAILEMCKLLAPSGHLILVENCQEGLDSLNKLRAKFGLDPIEVRWHNKYLPYEALRRWVITEAPLVCELVENVGNMYYIASRVIYAKLCKDQGTEPDYNNPINAIAAQLPTMGCNAYSPNFMIVLRNDA